MGQALRRATGRIGGSRVGTTPSPSSLGKPIERRPPAAPVDQVPTNDMTSRSDGASRVNSENLLEDRDPQYDAMLSQMVGRIRPKPGGKLEMGGASVVEKYERPLPKLRHTTQETSRYEERPAPPGTLNVAQLRHVILLYQGKADDYDGPMNISQIAERFHVDVSEIQRILQFVSIPPEDKKKNKNKNNQE